MVVSRRFPPRSGLRLCVLGLPSREDLAIPAQRNTPPPRWSLSGDSLEQGIAREIVGTGDLRSLDPHDALGDQPSPVQHYRVERLLA